MMLNAKDFNYAETKDGVTLVKLSEINTLIEKNVLHVDEEALQNYHFDTRVKYNSDVYTKEEAKELFGNLV